MHVKQSGNCVINVYGGYRFYKPHVISILEPTYRDPYCYTFQFFSGRINTEVSVAFTTERHRTGRQEIRRNLSIIVTTLGWSESGLTKRNQWARRRMRGASVGGTHPSLPLDQKDMFALN